MKHIRIVLWVFLFLFSGAGQTLSAQEADALVSELPLDSLLKRMGWKSVIDSLEVRRLESRLKKKKKAKNSDAGMFFTLYICYNLGLGAPIDKEKAVDYCRKSADLGYGLAQNDLGYYYESGEQIPPDDSLAFHYYRLAAEQKLPEALYNLGRMSLDGDCGQLRDAARAVACLQEAARMSYPPALLRLGGYYFQDTVPDYPRAASYFRKAAEWGCEKSAHLPGIDVSGGAGSCG